MRRLLIYLSLPLLASPAFGCDAILGIDRHDLASTAIDGGPVTALLCGGDGTCVSGGIVSVGRVPNQGGAATLADGASVTLTDDGFDLGGTMCDTSGATCVTGAITP
jgi:hypothetical protein